MIIAILFGSLVTLLTHGTVNMEDCQKLNFEPKACKPSEVLNAAKK